jgi:hypothetical protein
MAEALILKFAGIGEADYYAVNKHLGIDAQTGAGEWPYGLLSHAAGTADDGTFTVSEVWATRADQEAFLTSRLGPALAAAGVTVTPSVCWVALAGDRGIGS